MFYVLQHQHVESIKSRCADLVISTLTIKVLTCSCHQVAAPVVAGSGTAKKSLKCFGFDTTRPLLVATGAVSGKAAGMLCTCSGLGKASMKPSLNFLHGLVLLIVK